MACSEVSESGTSYTCVEGSATYSAKVPGVVPNPSNFHDSHKFCAPEMQASQCPQLTSGFATTRRPSARRPSNSCPSTSPGLRSALWPKNPEISEPQTPAT